MKRFLTGVGLLTVLVFSLLALTGCVRGLAGRSGLPQGEESYDYQAQDSQSSITPLIYLPTRPEYQDSRNPYAFHVGQCTWYVFGRIQEPEVGLPSFLQDYQLLTKIFANPTIVASQWDDRVNNELNKRVAGTQWEGLGLNIGTALRPKSIAVWDYSGLSHVAFVENDRGEITESNHVLRDSTGRYYLNPGEVVMRETVPIYDDKGKLVGNAQRFQIMKVVREETRGGKRGYVLEPVPDGGNNLRGWAEWKEVIPGIIWNYTRISRTPSNLWGTPKYIYLNVPDIPGLSSPPNNAYVPGAPTLRWGSAARAVSYHVQVARDPDFKNIIFERIGITATEVQVSPPLVHNTRYWWRVKSSNTDGNSPWSEKRNFIVDRTPPTPPGNLRVTGSTFSRIDLAWNPSTDDLSGVASYRIYRDGSLLAIVPGTQTSFRDQSVKAGIRYCYRVSAIDSAGNESTRSNEACARAVPWPR
jgi:surface antigen